MNILLPADNCIPSYIIKWTPGTTLKSGRHRKAIQLGTMSIKQKGEKLTI